jgi:hypothetical protein
MTYAGYNMPNNIEIRDAHTLYYYDTVMEYILLNTEKGISFKRGLALSGVLSRRQSRMGI